MENIAWRFPDNRYTNENGLDTSDMEMFKKDPVASLAREICQNSIDASNNDKPVRVEFSLFKTSRNNIPGIEQLTQQINACYEYKKDSLKEGKALTELKKNINQKEITCLRISDFNTTGIIGAKINKSGTPFYNLTKGSGISDKCGSSGGSKGIGKFASFVVSSTNTVFYSTKACDDSCAYIGISKLRSTPITSQDPDLLTMGIGYYGIGEKNLPILEELNFDPTFKRDDFQYGTDVYIIGFKNSKGWQNDIISKVLESFMVAIMFDKLEVVVDNIILNKNTIKEIIYNDNFQSDRTKTEIKEICAQYELLANSESVIVQELQVDESNSIIIYLKQYKQYDETKSTKHCVIIRYPYMKITHINTGAYMPFSALCIIPDNDLNQKLRAIENPQHTDWEIKRLNDSPEDKRITRTLKKKLETSIKNFIRDILKESTSESTDIEGAGEFLPSQNDAGETLSRPISTEQIIAQPIVPVKPQTPKTVKSGENGEGYNFTKGDISVNGDDGKKPKKKKEVKPSPNPAPKPEPNSDEDTKVNSGKSSVLRKEPLSGMRYRTVVTDKANGKYDCIFTSKYNEKNCEFIIRLCGEATDKYPVEIISASINSTKCKVKDGKIIELELENGKTYTISYTVKSHEMFASEVILNAYR